MNISIARRAALALVSAITFSAVGALPAAYAAPPRGACSNPGPAHPVVKLLPWAQQLLAPQRAWPYTSGGGVTVAVVDSGVDADHPQLRRKGKVLPGRDFFLVGKLPGNYDCVSHGTEVAGIIAGDPAAGIGFQGIAPGARILPVRITDREADDTGTTQAIDQYVLARGIRYAVDSGARVLNLSLAGTVDRPAIRAAIAYAVKKDVVVVAAVGNKQQNPTDRMPSFPAGYPGVIGVGAVDINGARLSGSQIGSYVDLVAPGAGVLGTTRQAGHAYLDGTSFATPFVAATAALVRSAWPKLTARQVAQRLAATATPARGGTASPEYGAGIVDPYRAVTEGMDTASSHVLPAMTNPPPDQQLLAQRTWWAEATSEAKRLTLAASLGCALVVLVTFVLISGRRRNWAAGRTNRLRHRTPRDDLLPERLFADR